MASGAAAFGLELVFTGVDVSINPELTGKL
jgi:hypothetical protein